MKNVLLFQSAFREVSEHREFEGVKRFAKLRGWSLTAIGNTEHLPSIHDVVKFWNPDGCIIANMADTHDMIHNLSGMPPVVFLDCNPSVSGMRSACVVHDSNTTSIMAAKELMTLNCASYAYVAWYEPHYWNTLRYREFKKALAINGHAVRKFIPEPSDIHDHIGLQKRLRLFLRSLPKPCAIFAANDKIGVQVIYAARAEKLSIPDNLAVIGVDDNKSICEAIRPTLSSILPDFTHGGYLAAEMLDRLMSNPVRKQKLVKKFGPLCVIHRESTHPRKRYTSPTIDRALYFIREHAGEGIGVNDVAAAMNCSRRMAEMRFNTAMGHSIMDEMMNTRLENVKTLLVTGRMSLMAIAQICGWKSLPILCRYFKKKTGLTLSAWRSVHAKGHSDM